MDKTTFAKNFRKNQTDAEKRLWYSLRARQFEGLKFRRQQPIGSYIVDFVNFDQKLIIELDGSQHLTEEGLAKDKIRTKFFTDQGYKVLRFFDNELLTNLDGTLTVILENIKQVKL